MSMQQCNYVTQWMFYGDILVADLQPANSEHVFLMGISGSVVKFE